MQYAVAVYLGGFAVATGTLPWVIDRAIGVVDARTTSAVLGRVMLTLGMALAWPLAIMLLLLLNGVRAAGSVAEVEPAPPAPAPEPPKRRSRPAPPSLLREPDLLSGPENAPRYRSDREVRAAQAASPTLVGLPQMREEPTVSSVGQSAPSDEVPAAPPGGTEP